MCVLSTPQRLEHVYRDAPEMKMQSIVREALLEVGGGQLGMVMGVREGG